MATISAVLRPDVDLVHEGASQSLLVAAAKGNFAGTSTAQRPIPHGRLLGSPGNLDFYVTYDTSESRDGEEHPGLKVDVITYYATENVMEHRQQIAVNKNYICYALKQGHMRIICKNSSARTLAKGHHAGPVTDARFFSDNSNILVSAAKDGQVMFWKLSGQTEDTISASQVGAIKFGEDFTDVIRLAWCPTDCCTLAIAYGSCLTIWKLPNFDDTAFAHVVEDDDLPDCARALTIPHPGNLAPRITTLAFSADGRQLACGSESGKVHVWEAPFEGVPGTTFVAYLDEVGSVIWLTDGPLALLLTGNNSNQELKVWRLGKQDPAILQTVVFDSETGPEGFFNRMVYESQSQLVILTNAKQPAVYTLHLSPQDGSGEIRGFDYLAEFKVNLPVVSLQACTSPLPGGHDGEVLVQLYCIQTSAIQQYEIEPAICSPPSAQPPLQQPPPPSPATVFLDVTVPPAAQHNPQVSSGAFDTPGPEGGKAESVGSTPASHSGTENGDVHEQPPLRPGQIVVPPPNVNGEHMTEASPAPNRVPTPRGTMLERLLSGGGAGEPSPPGPPRLLTPTNILKGTVPEISRTASSASAASADAAQSSHTPNSVSAPPPEARGLAATRQDSSTDSSQASQGGAVLAGLLGRYGFFQQGDGSRVNGLPAHTDPVPPPITILQRPDAAAAHQHMAQLPVPQATAPPPDSLLRHTEAQPAPGEGGRLQADKGGDAAEELLVAEGPPGKEPDATLGRQAPEAKDSALQSDAATPSRLSADGRGPPKWKEAAAAPGIQSPGGLAALGIAPNPGLHGHALPVSDILTKIADVQKKLQQAVVQSSKDSQRGMRDELKKESTRLELLYRQEVEAMRTMVVEERKMLQAEEQGRLRELLKVLSESINKDLVLKMQDVVRREVAAEGDRTKHQIDTAIQISVERSLPAILPSLLQHAFVSTFEKTLIPAFEKACQNMFSQMRDAIHTGVGEQLEYTSNIVSAALKDAVPLGHMLAQAEQVATKNEILAQQLEQCVGGAQDILAKLPLASQNGRGIAASAGQGGSSVKEVVEQALKREDYQAAFLAALEAVEEFGVVEWLCQHVDPYKLFSKSPMPLEQSVVLSLLQQLGVNLHEDLDWKLDWVREAAMVVDPRHPQLAVHVPVILQPILQILQHEMATRPELAHQIRPVLHVINASLRQYQ